MQYETVVPDQDAEQQAMLATDKIRKVKVDPETGAVTSVVKPPMGSRRTTRVSMNQDDPSLVATQGPGIVRFLPFLFNQLPFDSSECKGPKLIDVLPSLVDREIS
jgi:hypothetical protein